MKKAKKKSKDASKKKTSVVVPTKKIINVKILPAEKKALKGVARRYAGGNVTKLVRLLARGYFAPRVQKKAA